MNPPIKSFFLPIFLSSSELALLEEIEKQALNKLPSTQNTIIPYEMPPSSEYLLRSSSSQAFHSSSWNESAILQTITDLMLCLGLRVTQISSILIERRRLCRRSKVKTHLSTNYISSSPQSIQVDLLENW